MYTHIVQIHTQMHRQLYTYMYIYIYIYMCHGLASVGPDVLAQRLAV